MYIQHLLLMTNKNFRDVQMSWTIIDVYLAPIIDVQTSECILEKE